MDGMTLTNILLASLLLVSALPHLVELASRMRRKRRAKRRQPKTKFTRIGRR